MGAITLEMSIKYLVVLIWLSKVLPLDAESSLILLPHKIHCRGSGSVGDISVNSWHKKERVSFDSRYHDKGFTVQ